MKIAQKEYIDEVISVAKQTTQVAGAVVSRVSRIGKKAYLNSGIGFSGGTLGRDLKILQSKIIDIDYYDNNNIFKSVYNQIK